jgi:hypothetical protein
MALSIRVAPRGDEWLVHADGLADAIVFPAGGKAEAAGRALAERMARQGRTAELRIYLRDGSLAGAFVYPPGSAVSAA